MILTTADHDPFYTRLFAIVYILFHSNVNRMSIGLKVDYTSAQHGVIIVHNITFDIFSVEHVI